MLYRKSTCANKWNLRRILAVAMIMIVAFDNQLNVYAASQEPAWEVPVSLSYTHITATAAKPYSIQMVLDASSDSTSSGNTTYNVLLPFYFKRDSSSSFDIPSGFYQMPTITVYFYIAVVSGQTSTQMLYNKFSSLVSLDPDVSCRLFSVGSQILDMSGKAIPSYNSTPDSLSKDGYLPVRLDITVDSLYFSGNHSNAMNFLLTINSSGNLVSAPKLLCFFDNQSTILTSDMLISSEPIDKNVDNIRDQMEKDREEDREDAGKAGDDSKSFVEDALDLENKWEILWYPIKFTNNILSVFTGGTSAAVYQDTYGNIVGYSYNEDLGTLEPVINHSRAVARSGGTIITFPAFTLPVLNVQIWDSYDFDLSIIKDDFSLLFDSLYVAESILEVYWFVGFLRDKYDEVFG